MLHRCVQHCTPLLVQVHIRPIYTIATVSPVYSQGFTQAFFGGDPPKITNFPYEVMAKLQEPLITYNGPERQEIGD